EDEDENEDECNESNRSLNFCSTTRTAVYFMPRIMKPAVWHRMMVPALLLVLLGCSHFRHRHARTVPEQMVPGDPATNVIIVPASAGWKLRAGTNHLPSAIISLNPFPFRNFA